MSVACNTYRREEKCIYSFEGKRPLGRSRHRWEDNIKRIVGK